MRTLAHRLSAIAPALLSLTVVCLAPDRAPACTCIQPMPPQETMAQADEVFAGLVTDASPTGDGRVIYTFEPSEIWKGSIEAVIEVGTDGSAATCGDFFDVGTEYIVYAYLDENNDLQTNMCTRNTEYDTGEAAALGAPIWGQAPAASFTRGDANGDLKVDLADAVAILSYLFQDGGNLPCLEAADVNDDAKVDLTDPIALLSYEFQGGPAPADPFKSCGSDPTEDALGCSAPPTCQ